jgi:hypothetical protein
MVSSVFELLKDVSGNFKKPVTFTFKFDLFRVKKGQYAAIFYYDEVNKTWIEIGGTVKENTITAEVNHFTKFAVLAVDVIVDGEHLAFRVGGHDRVLFYFILGIVYRL